MTRAIGRIPVLVLWAAPLLLALPVWLAASFDPAAWRSLFAHPQLYPALGLSVFTGSAATLFSFALATLLACGLYGHRVWQRVSQWSGYFIALPHLAFAIGFAFLIMPSGMLARLAAGGDEPPGWITTQDPLGLSLIMALVLKETPFLVWMYWSVLARADLAPRFRGQFLAALSLGHGEASAFMRVLLPQVLPKLVWPLLAVWIYGATVVDMALVIGPTQPPVFSVLVWQDLNDADALHNARGMAGAFWLTSILTVLAVLMAAFWGAARPVLRYPMCSGPAYRPARRPVTLAMTAGSAIACIYAAAIVVLCLMSGAARWPYPSLWPEALHLGAWQSASADALGTSVALGLATTLAALVLAVLWLEAAPARHDRPLSWLAGAAIMLPALAISAGQYRMLLDLRLTGSWTGLFLVHLTPVFAYVWIVLRAPYRAFDPRWKSVGASLHASPVRFWRSVKLPLLRAPIAAAAAIGFAVSLAQFVPAQLAAAGRHVTLPMEAVSLSSGGNRSLTAVHALLLALPCAAAFALAAVAGRERRVAP